MKSLHRWVVAVASAAFSIACSPAVAQWQVQNGAIPVGRGAGVTGFDIVGGSSGSGVQCLLDTNPPSFGTCPGGGGGSVAPWTMDASGNFYLIDSGLAPIVLHEEGSTNHTIAFWGGNNASISYASNSGQPPGDVLRTSRLLKRRTTLGPQQQESADAVDIDAVTGNVEQWKANTAYLANEYMSNSNPASGDSVHIWQVAANCTTSSTTPSGATSQTNGTCTLNYIGDGINNGKGARYDHCQVGLPDGSARAGQFWCGAHAVTIWPGSLPRVQGGFVVNQEFDMNNVTGIDCAPGNNAQGCQMHNLFVNGISRQAPITSSIFLGGAQVSPTQPAGQTWQAHVGILMVSGHAKDVGIKLDSGATYEIQSSGRISSSKFLGYTGLGAPTIGAGCGTGAHFNSTNATDVSGQLVLGSDYNGANTCTLTFKASYVNQPDCIVTWPNGGAAATALTSTGTGTLNVRNTSSPANQSFVYMCMGF